MKSGPSPAPATRRRSRGLLLAGAAALAVVSACGTAPAPTAPTAAPAGSSAAPATAEKTLTEASAEPTAAPSVDPSVVPDAPASSEPSAEPSAAPAPAPDSPYATLLGRLDRTSGGTLWNSCAEHPATAGSLAEAWCDNDNPALALKVVFNSYDDATALADSVSGVYQQATGDTAKGCDSGGRAAESRGNTYTVACGVVVDEGTTYYSLVWASQDKGLRGQVWDQDPALVWKWWYDNTPF